MNPKKAKKLLAAAAADRSELLEQGGKPARFKGAGPRMVKTKSKTHYEPALNGGEGFNLPNGEEIMALSAANKKLRAS